MSCLWLDHPQVILTPGRTVRSNQFCIVSTRTQTSDSAVERKQTIQRQWCSLVTALHLLDTNNVDAGLGCVWTTNKYFNAQQVGLLLSSNDVLNFQLLLIPHSQQLFHVWQPSKILNWNKNAIVGQNVCKLYWNYNLPWWWWTKWDENSKMTKDVTVGDCW